MSTETIEKHEFQAETRQVLDLMIHSLYSNREIFLRELISNASDACDKLRFESLSDDSLMAGDAELRIRVSFDKEAGEVIVSDNGIGMSRDEVIENIGTIARSGTRRFLEAMSGDAKKDSGLIGQFGVGFYSSFIVADKVALTTRRAGSEEAVQWVSEGQGEYTLETVAKEGRGTEIRLHLKEDAQDYLNEFTLQNLIRKYSDHIGFTIEMLQEVAAAEEDEDKETEVKTEWKAINQASALWTLPKNDISDEQYQAFYKHLSHDFNDAMSWAHNRVEGTQAYTTLIYLPEKAPFDMFMNREENRHGFKLYVKRVFIMDAAEQLLPMYLRFVKGIVDSDDLPLNVSREILQENKLVASIRASIIKRSLDLLGKLAKDEKEKYQQFWDAFGEVLKEGPAEDHANQEKIAALLRFATTHDDSEKQTVSLDEYIERMQEGQEKIYYITADSHQAALGSPHLEIMRKKGLEVLLLSDRVDEWMMGYLREYQGKSLQSIAKGDLGLEKFEGEEEKKAHKELEEKAGDLPAKIAKALSEKIEKVEISHRLVDSPACLVLAEGDMAMHMQKLLKQAGHDMPGSKPTLEINPAHPFIERMQGMSDENALNAWSELLYEQSLLAEGGQLEDPAGFVKRLNKAMLELGN